jgi:hypothetical protein
MAMSSKDKTGAIILVVLFIILGVMLAVFTPRPDSAHDPSESPIIQQRIQHLERSR